MGATGRGAWIRAGLLALIIAGIGGAAAYWKVQQTRVYVDSSSISAPQIGLAPSVPGTLQEVYVHEGDVVPQQATVARVGNELIKSKVAGVIVSVPATIGAQIAPNQPVVTMIDPTALRVVGEVDEDKGLSRIQVGDAVTFTVDAYGSQKFTAVVDEVSPSSQQSGIVFNISDKREVKQFDVKARFDTSAFAFLKNGMSARMWIFTR